ncbi:aminodeoxychorismate lyase [Methylophaga sp. OBS4]|uniref:aminodeoxychorismate lyase n=1 Tax=Methylophaga sp. OBS4 TaxID=2991935 RepID=UPI0022533D74|nr:aminodeoxychorismate lyase [Methylophaga sp. OBS4]MCX4188651.1 aminodeoxychorismate lyase [Methylophaga sp. OBS4]
MILINGQPENRINVSDRGLQYGDGLFETIAYRNGELELIEAHLQRLMLGCQRLNIPFTELDLLKAELVMLCAQTAEDSVIKIMLTRGEGGRGYFAAADIKPTRIVAAYPLPVYPQANQSGITVCICKHRLGINPTLAGIKHMNRLEQVLARSEWQDDTATEGLMLDINDKLIEGTMSNLFLVKQGRLFTPELHNCGIEGVMRARVIKIAQTLNISVYQQTLILNDLQQADEVFLTNSLIGIWPVTKVVDETWQWPHGAVSKQLQNELAKTSH